MLYRFTEQQRYRIAQITDCHLLATADGSYKQVKPAQHLQAIVRQLQQELPDAVLLTGDLTQDHSAASYQLLAEILAQLACPVFCVPGNHDDPEQLHRLCQNLPFRPERDLRLGAWQLLLINTKGDTPAGVFPPAEQQWLAEQASASQAAAIWLFCHHHPRNLHCFIDLHGQTQQTELWQAIASETRIRGIAHGHAHYAYHQRWQQVDIVGCPASSVQFLPVTDWQTEDGGPQWCDWEFGCDGAVRWQFRQLAIESIKNE